MNDEHAIKALFTGITQPHRAVRSMLPGRHAHTRWSAPLTGLTAPNAALGHMPTGDGTDENAATHKSAAVT